MPAASNSKIVTMISICLIVSFIGQHLGVGITPTDFMPGGVSQRDVEKSESLLTSRIYSCKPDAKKERLFRLIFLFVEGEYCGISCFEC